MAEGSDGVKSRNLHIEMMDKMCEICLEEDSFKPAPWYCKQCKQQLCENCKDYHRRLAALKSHELVPADEVSHSTSVPQENFSDEGPMCKTHNKPLEFYCEQHISALCASCKLLDHRKCQNIQDLEHVAAEKGGLYDDVLEHLKTIDDRMEDVLLAMETEKDTLSSEKDSVIRKIRNKMKQLEILAQKKISEVETTFKQENDCLDHDKEVIMHSRSLVSKSIQQLEMTTAGSAEEKFLAAAHADREAGKYIDILNESGHVTHRKINFKFNTKLTEVDSVGDLILEKAKLPDEHQPHFKNVLTVEDKDIDWFNILPNGQMVVLVSNPVRNKGSQIRLYNASNAVLSQLSIYNAVSASVFSDRQIIIPMRGKYGLQVIDINGDNLTLGDFHQTTLRQIIITKFSDNSVLTEATDTNKKICFQILDLTGNVQTHIPLSTEVAKELIGDFMSLSEDKKTICIVDKDQGCFGFNLKGELLFQYKHKDSIMYAGLATDGQNSHYMTCCRPEEVSTIQLSPAGEYRRRVLRHRPEDHMYPMTYVGYKLYMKKILEGKKQCIACTSII